jgi:ribonucleoside-diphosphate reductase alpha chain
MAKSLMDYIFRRLAIDHLPVETRQALGINTATERSAALDSSGSYPAIAESPVEAVAVAAPVVEVKPVVIELKVEEVVVAPRQVHSSAELFEMLQGTESDAPLCFNCGIKMRPSGSCHVCEGCGSTSGCS